MPDDMYTPSPFPRSAAADAMGSFNQGMSNILPMIAQFKQQRLMKQPLQEFLGAKSEDELPEQLRQFAKMPVGRLHQLSQLFGGSMGPLIKGQGGVPGISIDPTTGKITMTPQGGAPAGGSQPNGTPKPAQPNTVPLQGMKPNQVAAALQRQQQASQGMTDEKVSMIADQVQNGKLALSQVPGFGANAPKARVIAELAHRGANMQNLELDYQAKKDYIKNVNSPSFQNTIKLLNSVGPNMDTVVNLSDKIGRTFVKPLNKAQLTVMRNSGDADVAAYGAAAIEVSDQIAKILQGGGTGSGTSDAKLKQAGEILDGSFTPQQLKGVVSVMKTMLNERQNALSTMTAQTIGNQRAAKMPKIDPQKRYSNLIKQGKTPTQAHDMMTEEGY